jgi:antitoxin component of MazEF toxin-antitoxin module
MDVEISCHRAQKQGGALYILLPAWWIKSNGVEHGDELILGKNASGELCIARQKMTGAGFVEAI